MAQIVRIEDLRGENGTLLHGVFDFLHVGHIRHFKRAESIDIPPLIITVTADEFVNKGATRPFFSHDERAEMIAAIDCVQFVAINHGPLATVPIDIIKPRRYCKGREYANDTGDAMRLEREAVERHGGKLVFLDDDNRRFSSTAILQALGHE